MVGTGLMIFGYVLWFSFYTFIRVYRVFCVSCEFFNRS